MSAFSGPFGNNANLRRIFNHNKMIMRRFFLSFFFGGDVCVCFSFGLVIIGRREKQRDGFCDGKSAVGTYTRAAP